MIPGLSRTARAEHPWEPGQRRREKGNTRLQVSQLALQVGQCFLLPHVIFRITLRDGQGRHPQPHRVAAAGVGI